MVNYKTQRLKYNFLKWQMKYYCPVCKKNIELSETQNLGFSKLFCPRCYKVIAVKFND